MPVALAVVGLEGYSPEQTARSTFLAGASAHYCAQVAALVEQLAAAEERQQEVEEFGYLSHSGIRKELVAAAGLAPVAVAEKHQHLRHLVDTLAEPVESFGSLAAHWVMICTDLAAPLLVERLELALVPVAVGP